MTRPSPLDPRDRQVLLDLVGCSAALSDAERLRELGLELWRTAVAVGGPSEPIVVRLAGGSMGYSLVQLGPGASIVAHFDDLTGAALINIFSFQGIDADAAERVARELLGAGSCERHVITGRVSHV